MLKKILLLAAVCIIAVSDSTASSGQTGVLLNNGLSMPVLGLGTWTMDDHTAEDSVYFALKNGYRLIDTARYYGNEKGVGNAVRRAIKDGIVKERRFS